MTQIKHQFVSSMRLASSYLSKPCDAKQIKPSFDLKIARDATGQRHHPISDSCNLDWTQHSQTLISLHTTIPILQIPEYAAWILTDPHPFSLYVLEIDILQPGLHWSGNPCPFPTDIVNWWPERERERGINPQPRVSQRLNRSLSLRTKHLFDLHTFNFSRLGQARPYLHKLILHGQFSNRSNTLMLLKLWVQIHNMCALGCKYIFSKLIVIVRDGFLFLFL